MMPMPAAAPDDDDKDQKDGEKEEQKRRYRLQDALSLLNRVQEMTLLDADEIRQDEKMMGVLRQVRDKLGMLCGGARGGYEEDGMAMPDKTAKMRGYEQEAVGKIFGDEEDKA